jgi:hypothetical protein
LINVVDIVLIARPIEEVWAFMADLDNAHTWGLWSEATKTSQGPVGLGTTFLSSERGMGLKITATLKVTEWEPPRRMTFWSATFPSGRFGPLKPATLSFALDSLADGTTRVERQAGGQTHGAWKLLEPLLTYGIRREKEQDAVKRLLEAAAS